MTFTSLVNHMPGTTFLHLQPEFTKEIKKSRESISILRYLHYIFSWIEHVFSSILFIKNRMFYQGIAIGNGLTNPEIQYKAYTDYALEMGLIGKSDFDSINKLVPGCEKAIKTCGNFLNIHKSSFQIYDVKRYGQVTSLCSALLWMNPLSGADGGSACVSSYIICNQIFNRIMGIVGDKNVSKNKPNDQIL